MGFRSFGFDSLRISSKSCELLLYTIGSWLISKKYDFLFIAQNTHFIQTWEWDEHAHYISCFYSQMKWRRKVNTEWFSIIFTLSFVDLASINISVSIASSFVSDRSVYIWFDSFPTQTRENQTTGQKTYRTWALGSFDCKIWHSQYQVPEET